MKRILLTFSLFLFSLMLHSQIEINTIWKNQVNPIFQNLDKSKVPNAILLDYAMEFTNVPAYNGTLTDSTYVDANILGNIYKTLFMGKVTTATTHFPTMQTIATNWTSHRRTYNQTEQSTMVVAGLFYQYSRIRTDALATNKITVTKNKYYDRFINSVWQNPYETLNTIAFTPAINIYNKRSFGIVLPSNLLQTNNSSLISKIELNCNDGSGYKIISNYQKVFANYRSNGVYNWVFKTTLTNGTVLYSQTKVKIEAPLETRLSTIEKSGTTFPNNILIPGPGTGLFSYYNGAILRIDYAPSSYNGRITKPLIVAEGFDAGSVLTPEVEGGDRSKGDFIDDLEVSGNQLRTLLDFKNSQEYDIVYIDWQNGTNSIQHNSAVLKNVLAWVNANKQGNEPNVLLGQSMGGVVGRYTLANMETAGETHNVRLFVAHDSPMQGANTPLSLQYFSRHAYDQYTSAPILYGLVEVVIPTVLNLVELMSLGNLDIAFPSIEDVLTLQDTPAAMQMNYHYVDYSSNPTMAVHNAWQQEFETAGYPTQSRNVAISNGNECAVDHGFDPRAKFISLHDTHNPGFWGDLVHLIATPLAGIVTSDLELTFLGLLPGSSKYFFDFDLYANPDVNQSVRQVYWGKMRYEKKMLWLVKVSHTITERSKNAPNGYLPFDTYSGGYYNLQQTIGDYSSYLPSNTIVNPRYGFIPVVSALDIRRNNGNVNPTDYLKNYAGGTTPESALTSGFNNFIVDFMPYTPANNRHISFQLRNGNWLANELSEDPSLIDDCSFTCANNQINGKDQLCASAVYSAPTGGTTFNWTITQGSNLVTLTGNGTANVTLTRLPNASGQVTISCITGSTKCGSGPLLVKNIWVGLPEIYEFTSGIEQAYPSCIIGFDCFSTTLESSVISASFEGMTTAERDNPANWEWSRGNNLIMLNSYGKDVVVCPRAAGVSSFKVRAKNSCGWSDWVDYGSFVISNCYNNLNISTDTYTVYPNPSNADVNIDLRDQNNKPQEGAIISGELFDLVGMSKSLVTISNNRATFSVANLSQGIYILKIYIDGQIETHQVAVE